MILDHYIAKPAPSETVFVESGKVLNVLVFFFVISTTSSKFFNSVRWIYTVTWIGLDRMGLDNRLRLCGATDSLTQPWLEVTWF